MIDWISVKGSFPPEVDPEDSPHDYYLVSSPDFHGWSRAMYIDGRWMSSYSSQIVAEITHWCAVDKPIEVCK